jgi:SAM-dependent methyltransferase
MNDDSDNQRGDGEAKDDSFPVIVDVDVAAVPDVADVLASPDGPPPRPRLPTSRPPPKPKSRPSSPPGLERLPSLAPRRASMPPSAPKPVSEAPSIRPMRMIALGGDLSPRSEAPPSALERTSTRPPSVLPPGPTQNPIVERVSEAPVSELDVDPFDDVTPARVPGVSSLPPMPPRTPPAPKPFASPSPMSESGPEIEITTSFEHDDDAHEERTSVEEVPDHEVAPASDEEPIAVTEEAPIAGRLAPLAEFAFPDPPGAALPPPQLPALPSLPPLPSVPPEDGRDSEKSRKPPPPPKRGSRRSSPPAPSEHAVAQALEPATFEMPTSKPRAKPWWEELFTDDFGRGIAPLNDTQVRREVGFIEDSLGVAKGGVVLDLACGTGHHAVELASRGYGVVGFDLSLPQLAVAGEYAQERGQKINFLQGDMRDMSFDEVFDGVFCWNTSFGYFEEEKNVVVAQRVFKALRPGGSFLLDVVNRDFVVAHQPSQVWFEGDACVCMDDMSVDFITSRLRVKRTMMLDDGRTRECTFSIRVYALHELGKLLHDIGFRVTEASGHPAYPGVFFGATSPRVLILAQKP